MISLVHPYLPITSRLCFCGGNVLVPYLPTEAVDYDTVILDLWVGRASQGLLMQMLHHFAEFRSRFPNADIYVWGLSDSLMNPSIDAEVRKKMLRLYWLAGSATHPTTDKTLDFFIWRENMKALRLLEEMFVLTITVCITALYYSWLIHFIYRIIEYTEAMLWW